MLKIFHRVDITLQNMEVAIVTIIIIRVIMTIIQKRRKEVGSKKFWIFKELKDFSE